MVVRATLDHTASLGCVRQRMPPVGAGLDMLKEYKEIFFGLAFGIGAVIIDTAMDAMVDQNSFADEVAEHPGMLFYRGAFIVLGLVVGWLLWQNNRREREVRTVTEALQKLRQECEREALLESATLQVLLTRDDLHPSDEALQLLREAYQRSQNLLRITEQPFPGVPA